MAHTIRSDFVWTSVTAGSSEGILPPLALLNTGTTANSLTSSPEAFRFIEFQNLECNLRSIMQLTCAQCRTIFCSSNFTTIRSGARPPRASDVWRSHRLLSAIWTRNYQHDEIISLRLFNFQNSKISDWLFRVVLGGARGRESGNHLIRENRLVSSKSFQIVSNRSKTIAWFRNIDRRSSTDLGPQIIISSQAVFESKTSCSVFCDGFAFECHPICALNSRTARTLRSC